MRQRCWNFSMNRRKKLIDFWIFRKRNLENKTLLWISKCTWISLWYIFIFIQIVLYCVRKIPQKMHKPFGKTKRKSFSVSQSKTINKSHLVKAHWTNLQLAKFKTFPNQMNTQNYSQPTVLIQRIELILQSESESYSYFDWTLLWEISYWICFDLFLLVLCFENLEKTTFCKQLAQFIQQNCTKLKSNDLFACSKFKFNLFLII